MSQHESSNLISVPYPLPELEESAKLMTAWTNLAWVVCADA